MKKTMMQLAITGLVLACSQAVFAQTYVLRVFDGIPPTNIKTVENGIHKNGHGYVNFQANHDEGGVVVSVDVTVVLQQAAKSYTYSVQHGPKQERNYLTTDKKGNGVVLFTVMQPFATTMGKNIIIHVTPTLLSKDTSLWYAYNPFGPW